MKVLFLLLIFCSSIFCAKSDFGVELVKELTPDEKTAIEKIVRNLKFGRAFAQGFSLIAKDGKEKKVFIKVARMWEPKFYRFYYFRMLTEVRILTYLGKTDFHPSVHLLHHFELETEGTPPIVNVTSFVESPFGNLQEALLDKSFCFSLFSNPDIARMFFWKIAQILHRLHQLGVFYRGLSPKHIMVTKNGTPILINFGYAIFSSRISSCPENEKIYIRSEGVRGYMPEGPGISELPSEKYDWYTFGKLLMFVVEKFAHSFHSAKNLSSLEEAKRRYSDEDFADLVWNLTLPDQKDRFDYDQIINHPYFAKIKTPPSGYVAPEFKHMIVPWWNRIEVWIFMTFYLVQMGITIFLTINKKSLKIHS